MLKKVGLFVLVLVAAAVLVGAAMAAEETTVTVVKETTQEVVAAPVNVNNTVCPVCGATVAKAGENTAEVNDKVYETCCASCKEEFGKDSAKYAAIADASVKPVEKTLVTTATTMVTTEAPVENM